MALVPPNLACENNADLPSSSQHVRQPPPAGLAGSGHDAGAKIDAGFPRLAVSNDRQAADLNAVVAQLGAPRHLLDATSPPLPLGPVEIEEGVSIVLRSGGTPFLALEAACGCEPRRVADRSHEKDDHSHGRVACPCPGVPAQRAPRRG